MKLWIDVLTPKQALFAKALADRAPSKVKCTLTTRKYPELDQFLRKLRLRTLAFGKHGGADLGEKLKASLEREIELYNYVKEHDFDCSLSFISPEAARVSFGLGIPHYISSDSPHAKAACRLAVPLARSLFYPFPIKAGRWTQYGLKKSQVHSYHALDPWAWISKTKIDSDQERSVIIRLEESFASYFESGSGVSDVIDHLIRIIPPTFEIIVIARYPEQRAWAAKKFGKRCTVPKGVVDATALISCSSLVIGGGGTMTQEAALLGIPNISYFPSARLDVFENFYFPRKLSVSASNPAELVRETKRLVQNIELERKDFSLRAEKEVRHFEDPAKFIFEKLDALNQT